MKNVANTELKDSLENLARRTFDFYNRVVSQYPIPPRDPNEIFYLVSELEDKIKAFNEYKQCIEVVNADVNISSLFGKLVGTVVEKFSTADADECVLQFIYQLYLEKNTFDYLTFSDHYGAFEELFYAEKLRYVDTVRLHNFATEVDEIVLEEGLVIRKLPHKVDERTKIQEMRYRPHVGFTRSDFVTEKKATKPKLVEGISPEPSPKQVNREITESGDLFDLVIKALRILKSSAVYRDHTISTETITFSPSYGITSRSQLIEYPLLGNKCVLSANEAEELKTVFKKMKLVEDHQPFKIASNRLGFGLERRLNEDRLLDFMIGLESLYLPDGNDELTFRLSLRVAFTTSQEMEERKKTFKFLRKMYGQRSKIAHGKKNELTKDDISKIEELLRQSLKIYLDNSNAFTANNLDNIYFNQ